MLLTTFVGKSVPDCSNLSRDVRVSRCVGDRMAVCDIVAQTCAWSCHRMVL